MRRLIETAFAHSRTVLLALALLLVAGAVAYRSIPKEADPDIQVPIVYVSVRHEGISPEDAERLLVRPLEQELRALEGLKEMRAVASQDHASVTLEFEAGTDIDAAIADVREKVDLAKADFPDGTEEPTVNEVNLALFPVLVVTLSGEVPQRVLYRLARELRDEIEALPQVLEAELVGEREELLEVVIDPRTILSYGLELESVLRAVDRNNRLVAAGALDAAEGRYAVKVPGVFETFEDLAALPIKASDGRVVRLGDIAEIRPTFKDAEGTARFNGRPAVALEVKKRIGANIIDTIARVRETVQRVRARWPEVIEVGFLQDKSDRIARMLNDLQNNVLSAILLVTVVVIAALGLRSGLLVGFAVPASLLTGILVLALSGLTVNIVVLFSLILSVGMLVDGAIVVTEFADRKMAEGLDRRQAYRQAAMRMAWPITASTLTTLAAFLPLVFWPGIVGEFMKYLPITLLATLTASLAMALVFVPGLGAIVGRPGAADPATMRALSAAEGGRLEDLRGLTGLYLRVLQRALRRPGTVALVLFGLAIAVYALYGVYGRGVQFFPDVEPEESQLLIHARGDLSVRERDALVRAVEDRILDVEGLETVYARSGLKLRGDGIDDDVVGIILLEFLPWDERRPVRRIMEEIRARTADIPGIWVEERVPRAGPPVAKPVEIRIASKLPDRLDPVVEAVRARFEAMPELVDVSDSRPAPGIEWHVLVDREQASRFGSDIAGVGATVQLVTNGILLGTYRPDEVEEDVEIRARFPVEKRGLGAFDDLVVNTPRGTVPLSTFVRRVPRPRVGDIDRVDGRRSVTVSADVREGVLVDDVVRDLKAWVAAQDFDPEVQITFRGEDEEQAKAQAFLGRAFAVALFLIAIVLVTQFNSFYQALLILSAVLFSTVGVLLGLLATGQPFGIVMSGVGVIALAGIVVNNNIVLIDTYNELRRRGLPAREAILRTGAQRLRPVLLTTVTTSLGLMPMVLRLNIDLIGRRITVGGPSTDWWVQLSSAVAGGLAFATLLTLVLTPCLLALGVGARERLSRLRSSLARPPSRPQAEAPLATPAE